MSKINKKPKVLIIIPTFNGEKYVNETIKCCLNQTYKHLEITVIDDFSEDNTIKILNHFSDKINLITNDRHVGLPKNLNRVLKNSKSEYFVKVDQDDLIEREHVANMLNFFDNDTVGVFCNPKVIDKEGNFKRLFYEDKLQTKKTKKVLEELCFSNFISGVGMMHKTSNFKKIDGIDEKYDMYWEWLYYVQITSLGKIKYNPTINSSWRNHDTNSTLTFYSKKRNKSFLIYKLRCKLLAFSKLKKPFLLPKFLYFIFIDFVAYFKGLLSHNKKIIKLFSYL